MYCVKIIIILVVLDLPIDLYILTGTKSLTDAGALLPKGQLGRRLEALELWETIQNPHILFKFNI